MTDSLRSNGGKRVAKKPARVADPLHHGEMLAALRAFKRGDFAIRMRDDMMGVDGQIAETFNELVSMVASIENEAKDVCLSVGKEGIAVGR